MSCIFSIEGNIGSGKSTMISKLQKSLYYLKNKQIIYLPEPVKIWESIKDGNGKTILENG